MMSAQLEALQRDLEDSLASIGYEAGAGKLPLSVRHNQRLVHFLEWVVSAVHPGSCLHTEETERFEELKSSGKVLEAGVLDQALTTLGGRRSGGEEEGVAEVGREVGELKEDIARLKSQLHTLSCVHKSLNDHYGGLVHKRDELARQKLHSQKRYQQAMEVAQNDNKKVNAALESLVSSTQDVCSFHRGEGAGSAEATPTFLHEVPQESYHTAEDQYLAELTTYSKKQFFQGIAELAGSPGGAEVGVVDLRDPAQVLRGVSAGKYSQHSTELDRLQRLYPLVEVQCINGRMLEEHAVAACGRAEEELALLSQQPAALDHNTLRLQVQSREAKEKDLRRQLSVLAGGGGGELPSLLQDMAALLTSKVLHGDYDLKLARQQYFTSKQDKVIASLRSQQARQELLSMLYEVELRRHRETHRLLTTGTHQLAAWSSARERRVEAMRSGSLQIAASPRKTVDSRDKFAQRLCSLLDIDADAATSLVTHGSLEGAVERLVQQVASREAGLSASHREELSLTNKQEDLVSQLTRELFGASLDCAHKPTLSAKEYQDECTKLQALLSSLELNIKSLLKHFDSKKKLLQANPLLETERKLFVYFFTEPVSLSQEMAELTGRVEALAAAAANSAGGGGGGGGGGD